MDLTEGPYRPYGLAMTTTSPAIESLGDLLTLIRAATTARDNWTEAAARVESALEGNLPAGCALLGREGAAAKHRLETIVLHTEPDGSFSVVELICPPGEATAIHDHVTWCVFAVLAGTPLEERFVLDETGTALMPAGGSLRPTGTVSGGAPPGDIHRLSNPGPQTAVSLHIYGTDVSRIGSSVRRTYDLPIIEKGLR
jgi:predicted metal-dependent enzyme (double-stranded beta helix superfamily)